MSKRIGIITPGGDAPGMNACIRAIVRSGQAHGHELFGIKRGYAGLIDGEYESLDSRRVSNIIQTGGTILKSTRCAQIKTDEGLALAIAQLEKLELDHLIIIGGDGSFQAGYKFSRAGIDIIGIPASIDNDVFGTDETIGFDTALDTAVAAIDKIRDTATSFDRIFVVDVMGREHGFLALSIGVASGAEIIITPEQGWDPDEIISDIRAAKKLGKSSMIIIFAEGAGDAGELGKQIEAATGISTRVSKLGHIQRGGNPSGRSRILGSMFGRYAIDLIREGVGNEVICLKNNALTHIPLEHTVKKDHQVLDRLSGLARDLS